MVSIVPDSTLPRACVRFEQDLSGFADGELSAVARRRVLLHLDGCEGCRGYLTWVESHVRLHRHAAALQAVPIPALPRQELFAALTSRILRDNSGSLVRMLYELGKSYLLSCSDRSYIRVIAKRPVRIDTARRVGKRLARQSLTFGNRPESPLFERAADLLDGRIDALESNLDRGRRLLEELLVLDPEHVPARLYLGFGHHVQGRLDLAARQFQWVATRAADPVDRAMGLENLGLVHESRGDLRRAIRCFERVVSSGVLGRDRRFFTSLTNLAIFHAKLRDWDRSAEWFGRLAAGYPDKIASVRRHLDQASGFRKVLGRAPRFRSRLARECPALFGEKPSEVLP